MTERGTKEELTTTQKLFCQFLINAVHKESEAIFHDEFFTKPDGAQSTPKDPFEPENTLLDI